MSSDLKVLLTSNPKEKVQDNNLVFGTTFTDHMFVMDYDKEKGWNNARIEPYGPFLIEPANMVFHYGQAVFEGMKAFRAKDGNIKLFRPRAHLNRLNQSGARLCIPPIDVDFITEALKTLLNVDKDWVPSSEGTALYIRPLIIATDSYLGVSPSKTYRFYIILSPVGPYYKEGFNPVKIMVEANFVRAVKGGLGYTKTPANYAASLLAAEESKSKGYSQVLWLDGIEKKYIDEVGAMNIFFKIDNEIITPPLEGSILGGMTRDSVIGILKEWGMTVKEQKISIHEVYEAHEKGKLQEIFGTGTAAVISPVSELNWDGNIITVNNGQTGETSLNLYKEITGIQYGNISDKFDWLEQI